MYVFTVIGIFDTIFLISQLITLGLVESVDKYEFRSTIDLTSPLMEPTKGVAYTCSIYLTILLTIERYIAICHLRRLGKSLLESWGTTFLHD